MGIVAVSFSEAEERGGCLAGPRPSLYFSLQVTAWHSKKLRRAPQARAVRLLCQFPIENAQAKKLRGNTIKGKWTWDEVEVRFACSLSTGTPGKTTWMQVYKHSSPEDAWIVIDGLLGITDLKHSCSCGHMSC